MTRGSMCGQARQARPEAGFTLLETLVALAVSSLCLLMLSGIVGRLAGTGRAVRAHAAVLDEGGAVMRLIAGLIGSVDQETAGSQRPNLQGDAQGFDVLSAGPAALDLGVETYFSLKFRPASTGIAAESGSLSLSWTGGDNGSHHEETIATGVREFQLAYRGRGSAEAWVSNWSKSVAALALVKATIRFSDARDGEPMSATFAVHSKLPRACVLDPLLAGCPQW